MLIQYFLSGFFVVVMLAAIALSRGSKMIALGVLLGTSGSLVFVWFPELATTVAHSAGVGRGADLLLYLWFAVSGLLLVGAYLRIRRLSEEVTELARAVALANPRRPAS
ncbi:hypothetical protein GCM10025771_25830 [Niveibacterium umoris]|uniref:DUF2304 domain-containing protein n=1 Tax=Niveibacterium umoris TaxID=1193620 RepID=A0A840BL11_9RHOO|nr:DUF2304 domain-containing protein [Niveibacterium umoris]MBB4012229.1 hypothetical protein [Niveibacterium umoris]